MSALSHTGVPFSGHGRAMPAHSDSSRGGGTKDLLAQTRFTARFPFTPLVTAPGNVWVSLLSKKNPKHGLDIDCRSVGNSHPCINSEFPHFAPTTWTQQSHL